MFTLRTDAKFDDLERLIDKISRPGNGQTRAIVDAIKQRFQENFTRQGSGAGRWAPLAPSTREQRRAQGYAGGSPILVRSGDYRQSFVGRGGNRYERVWHSPVGLTIQAGSDDRREPCLERGTRKMPARPVTLLDDAQETNLTRLIDFVVDQIERQFWR